MDIDINIKRASLISGNDFRPTLDEIQRRKSQEAPPDKWYIAILLSFFMGIATTIPMTFFTTANDYWMYKFRDTQFDTYDLNNKTTLQKMFVSANSITSSVPTVISIFLTGAFAHRFEMRRRFILTLGCTSLMFIIFTILVKVNTDSWQTLFFATALAVIATINFVQPLLGISSLSYLSRFPPFYMKINMFGTSVGGLAGSTLQIISLSIGDSSTSVALIYFTSGTVLIVITFLLAFLMNQSPVAQFYWYESKQESIPKLPWREYVEAFKRIWPLLFPLALTIGLSGLGHANITNLVVSESYTGKNENAWYDKYFVCVATFFLFDICQVFGRFFAAPLITKTNCFWFMGLFLFRTAVYSPLFIFCNAQPRTLPVWFPHDYQYMIILATCSISLSILMSITILSVPNLAGDKTEIAYMMLPAVFTLTATITSPLNTVYVNML